MGKAKKGCQESADRAKSMDAVCSAVAGRTPQASAYLIAAIGARHPLQGFTEATSASPIGPVKELATSKVQNTTSE